MKSRFVHVLLGVMIFFLSYLAFLQYRENIALIVLVTLISMLAWEAKENYMRAESVNMDDFAWTGTGCLLAYLVSQLFGFL